MTHIIHRSLRIQRARLAAAIEPLERRLLLTSVVVNTTADVTDAPGSSVVSLRDAINVANDSVTPTTITFNPTVFATAKTITLNGNALDISGSKPVTITGPAAGVTVNGNHASTDFIIDKGETATITGLTITGGQFVGGIDNAGTVTVTDSTISGNNSNHGGGIYNIGTATVTGCTISANYTGGNGGGIDSTGTLTLNNDTVSGNTNLGYGAGISNAGKMTLNNVNIDDNNADGNDSDEPTSEGGGIDNTGTITISNSSIDGNFGGSSGGGIENETGAKMTLADTTVSGNHAYGQGGIDNQGTAALTASTISGNSSGIFATPGGSSLGPSGGIGNSGSMTLTDCTISGNSTDSSGGGINNGGSLTLADCTISNNAAYSEEEGAAFAPTPSPGVGGGLWVAPLSTTVTLIENTIISGNQATGGTGPDVFGAVQSKGYNLIGQTNGSTGWVSTDLTGTAAHPLNALLAPLGSFGGPTQTQVPLPGSPAIGAGSVALIPAGVTTDQRGFARVVNGKVEIGSVELQAVSVVTVTPPVNQSVLAGVPTSIALGSFTDPSGKGPYAVLVIWGDGSPNSAFSVSTAGSLGSLTHTFTTTIHSFTTTILVSDASGDVSKPAVFGVGAVGVSGTVFEDDNGDGSQDNGEIGLGGVQVYADLGNVGSFVSGDPTAITDGNGVYTLEGLAAGNYIIRQIIPSGYAQTYPANGLGFHVTLVFHQVLPTQNFGDKFTQGAQSYITGTVFNDANGDGAQDNGEAGLAGVQVYADLGNVGYFVTGDPTTTTGGDGTYALGGLAAGQYIIRQVVPSGYAQTAPSGGLGIHLALPANNTLTGDNFGDKAIAATSATITGTVFNDANGDGAQDNGEAGLAGVQVYADLGNVGYFVTGDPTTTTNANGNYTLSGLAAGNYIVRQVQPLGDAQTSPSGGLGHHVTVSAGQTLSGQNFGDRSAAAPPAVITGIVFNDANGDGIQDDGEMGLASVQVYLDLGNVGYFVTGDPTTMTNATGGYTLSGLAAGNYIVRQALPLGYVQTTPANGFGRHVTVSAGQTLSGQTFGDKA